MWTLIAITSSFVIGCTLGFLFSEVIFATAANTGKAFLKKGNRWYPYNPFTGREPK